ncbi:MAG: TetR/AcrR family transcriptional regulator [Opitutales bacterium]
MKTTRTAALENLAQVFRTKGYSGSTMAELARTVGIQKSSLYHLFPGGKEEMGRAVLEQVRAQSIKPSVIEPLLSDRAPADRLGLVINNLRAFYRDGRLSCLLDVMSIGEGADLFQEDFSGDMRSLIDAFAQLAKDAGYPAKGASLLGEEAVASIHGSLILSRAMNDEGPFLRALESLPEKLL